MLNEPKIKEKILKIIGGDSDYEYYPKVADEIYELFLPALEALELAKNLNLANIYAANDRASEALDWIEGD